MRFRMENYYEGAEGQYVLGVSSRIDGNIHSLFVDVDKCDRLGELIENLYEVQERFDLATFYMVQSSPFKWHCSSFVARKWDEILDILCFLKDRGMVEPEYVYQSMRKGYCVLRTSSKDGIVPEVKYQIRNDKEEVEKKKNEYFKALMIFSVKEPWITRFKINNSNAKSLMSVLKEVNMVDPTFVIERERDNVYVLSKDKKQAFRRGMWVKERLAKEGVDVYFSVFK